MEKSERYRQILAIMNHYSSSPYYKADQWPLRLEQALQNEHGTYKNNPGILIEAIELDEKGYSIYHKALKNQKDPNVLAELYKALECFEAAIAITKHGHNAPFNKANVLNSIAKKTNDFAIEKLSIKSYDEIPSSNVCYSKGQNNKKINKFKLIKERNPNLKYDDKYPLNHFYPPQDDTDTELILILIEHGAIMFTNDSSKITEAIRKLEDHTQNVHQQMIIRAEEKYKNELLKIYEIGSLKNCEVLNFFKSKILEFQYFTVEMPELSMLFRAHAVVENLEKSSKMGDVFGGKDILLPLKLSYRAINDKNNYFKRLTQKDALFIFINSIQDAYSEQNGDIVCITGINSRITRSIQQINSKVSFMLLEEEKKDLGIDLNSIIGKTVRELNFGSKELEEWNERELACESWNESVRKLFGKVILSSLSYINKLTGAKSISSLDVFFSKIEDFHLLTEAYLDRQISNA